jgi:perosamine synthetase
MTIKNVPMGEFPVLKECEGIPLFYPHVPSGAIESVAETLAGRWIGQGPKVEQFEQLLKQTFLGDCEPLAVGSGTDALHMAYVMAGLKKGDKVLVPAFTCTATNIPLLYIGAEPVFVDIDPQTMNVSVEDIRRKMDASVKAIVTVDYGGICCNYEEINKIAREYGIPVIQDAAHAIGSKYDGQWVGSFSDFSIFSFQAIKTLTTGDGGLLAIKNPNLLELAKKVRWFGIDRSKKQGGVWENDIVDVGYKYQMTDIAAAIGIAGLGQIAQTIAHRKSLFQAYEENLRGVTGLRLIGPAGDKEKDFCPWLLTVIVDGGRVNLMNKLREHGIESAQVHYRNDRYSIFGSRRNDLPTMDALEERYLVLPLYNRVRAENVAKICDVIRSGW